MATDKTFDCNPTNSHHFPPTPSYNLQVSSPSLSNLNHLSPNSATPKSLSQIGPVSPAPLTSTAFHAPSSTQPIGHRFGLSSLSTWAADTKNFRIQGWDPILIIAQIIALQALHYLTLCVLTPPLLALFAKWTPL